MHSPISSILIGVLTATRSILVICLDDAQRISFPLKPNRLVRLCVSTGLLGSVLGVGSFVQQEASMSGAVWSLGTLRTF